MLSQTGPAIICAFDVVRKICPSARPAYLEAFKAGDDQIYAAGITSPRRLAHFLAQVLHETDGLTITEENMNYRAPRIREVWPSRPEAVRFAGDPQGLANSVYGGRMGNVQPGDGWRYRGRGLMQTTGREAYRKYGRRCGVDFEGAPELVLAAEHALKPALAEWVDTNCNALADGGDIRTITKRINGGLTGYASRCAWLRRVEKVLGSSNVDFVPRGPVSAAAAEKPKSATAVVVGALASAGATVAAAAPSTAHANVTGFAIVAAFAAVALVIGVALLVRHHLAVKKEG